MPHVDDGTLHAYLDGAVDALAEAGALPDGVTRSSIDAHFAACADCRSRLEAERDIRERAGIVLRDAAPAYAPPPPFTVPAPRTRRSWVPLSWAATVLLAVGAGWWGREIAGTAQLNPSPMRMESEAAGTAPAGDAKEPGAVTGNADAEASAPPSIATGAAAGADAEVLNRVASPPAVAPPAVAPQVAARTEEKPIEAQRAVAQDAVADRDVARDSTSRVQQLAAPQQATRTQDLARRSFQAAPPPPAAPAPMMFVPEPPLRALVAGTRSDTVRWQLVRDPQRMGVRGLRLAGGGEPVVRNATVVGYELVKVEQRLDTGEAIEVVTGAITAVALESIVVTGSGQRGDTLRQESAAVSAPALPVPAVAVASAQTTTLADGTSEVLLQTADGRVVALRGRIDMGRLRRLADTLVPLR